jgi:type II secretory pathway component GspD/PulD (secretin)
MENVFTMRTTMRKCCRNSVLAVLVFSLSVPPLAIAAELVAMEAEHTGTQTARHLLDTRITYSCTDLPIENVLMDLAELVKIDIIKSPRVTGNVTAKVTDKPLEEALTNILAAHDYTYIATDSMIRVVPLPETALMRDELVTRIYRITYADVNDVAMALKTFVSDKGRVAFNRGTSHIVVSDVERNIKAIDQFVEELDHETLQVQVEVRIYDITTKEGFDLGTAWHFGRNAPLETTGTPPSTLTSTTTVTTPGEADVTTVQESGEPTSQITVRAAGVRDYLRPRSEGSRLRAAHMTASRAGL